MRRAICGAAALLLSALCAAQPKPAPTPTPDHHDRKPGDVFTLKPLAGGVYALYGRGGNVGFYVGPDAVVVVDSQFPDIAPGIVQQIRTVTDKPIQYLVNTHHHPDHVGGNGVFQQFAIIIAQDNVRKRMLAAPQDVLREYPALLEKERQKNGDSDTAKFFASQIEWAKKVKVEEIPAPVLTFDSELRIYVGKETIGVWHTPPAHTDGDSVVDFGQANVLHMGDVFFNQVIPFIDVEGGGSARGYLAAIDGVIARVPANVTIIPGHGEVTDLAGLKGFRQYMADVIAAARTAKQAGKSKEEFLATVDLPAYKDYRGYQQRFKDNCAAAYDEIIGK